MSRGVSSALGKWRVLPLHSEIMKHSFVVTLIVASLQCASIADEKPETLRSSTGPSGTPPVLFKRPETSGVKGQLLTVKNEEAAVPVVVVRGTPYEMGRQLGEAVGEQ